jgi:hypothetical protein
MTDWFFLWNIYFTTQSVDQRPETVTETKVLVQRWVKASGHKGQRLAQGFQGKTVSSMISVKH